MALAGGVPLQALPPGGAGLVTELRIDGPARRRLLDLGFVSGTIVRAVRRSPLGDPTAYEVRGSILAVRREDAARILVQPVGTT